MSRTTLAACLLLVAAACGSEVLAPDVERVHLSLTLSQPEMVVGDTVEIRVVGTNPTGNTLRFTTRQCDPFHIRVLARSGQVVHWHPKTCNDMAVERVIEPGDSIVETVLFDGVVSPGSFLDAQGNAPDLVLAPGLYTVVAAPEDAAGNESNRIDLRIRP